MSESQWSQLEWKDPRLKTPEGRAIASKVFRGMREDGDSYEEIPIAVWNVRDNLRPEPWEVYALANPGKTAAQVEAWRTRHCRSVAT